MGTRTSPRANTVSTDQQTSNLPMAGTILSGIQEQIRFADSKAGFIAALNAVLFGFIGRNFDKLISATSTGSGHPALLAAAGISLGLYVVAMLASVVLVVMVVMSRFGELAPQSKVFFGHIARQYGKDYAKYVKDTVDLSDSDWFEQFGGQIVETSHIALTKHKWVCRAAACMLAALAFWAISFVVIAFLPSVSTP